MWIVYPLHPSYGFITLTFNVRYDYDWEVKLKSRIDLPLPEINTLWYVFKVSPCVTLYR